MRSCQVGIRLFTFVLALGASASLGLAQVKGFVEAIGFQGAYRPDCWTPMLVNLTSELREAAEYQICVYQEDLDKDRPVYTRVVTLTPKATEKFWVYFLPQPTGNGLPDRARGDTLAQLQEKLKVEVHTRGGTPLLKLPLTTQIENIDPKRGPFDQPRGTKLILAVVGGDSRPATKEYDDAAGLNEQVMMIPVGPADLPESVTGYEAVDAIVWFD